ncbi:MAG: hypothetical protein HN352_11920 [Bacteroidetes bacterium]|nr:hypothetical protein [Bacteroidota bacterium]MBT3748675.1 hypothetical protein [Bacteroidota bacterium]MBT4399644.1 hypothetical protein [Bacteroidota bacterium]MBT4409722.1 hypothetical protein [Bacteroidota bacterium]MBT7462511.1 hypothetical protein [Bacteroidota bacterium]
MIIAGFLGGVSLLVLFIMGILFFLLPIIALISIVRHDFDGNNKLIWIIVIIFLPYMGSILYFLFGRSQDRRR